MRRALFLLTLLLALPTAVYAQSHLDAEPGVYLNLGEVRAGSFTLDGTYTSIFFLGLSQKQLQARRERRALRMLSKTGQAQTAEP